MDASIAQGRTRRPAEELPASAALGLVKLDLLGLRMHTAIAKTLTALREQGIEVDFDRLPLDDPAT